MRMHVTLEWYQQLYTCACHNRVGEQNPSMWPQRWFIESGFWQALYALVLLSVLVLWRPVPHQKDLAGAFQVRARGHRVSIG